MICVGLRVNYMSDGKCKAQIRSICRKKNHKTTKNTVKLDVAARCEFSIFYFFPSNLQSPDLLSGGEQN